MSEIKNAANAALSAAGRWDTTAKADSSDKEIIFSQSGSGHLGRRPNEQRINIQVRRHAVDLARLLS